MAHDLSPADVILFKQHRFASFITDLGGATSHTAILARSLNIPSIVALHHARQLIRESELLIVDGSNGVVIVNPDANVLMEYELRREQWQLEREKLKRLKTTRAATLDGTRIELQANIELPEDVAQAKDNAAAGIGLFRSEFLFLSRAELPGEDEQFEAYRRVAVEMDGLPVTVRTLDLGADKHLNGVRSGSRPIQRSGCAQSACAWPSRRCSIASCARSCAPRTTARSRSWCRCCRPCMSSTRPCT